MEHTAAPTATPPTRDEKNAETDRCPNVADPDHSVHDHFCYDCGHRVNPPTCGSNADTTTIPIGHENCFQ